MHFLKESQFDKLYNDIISEGFFDFFKKKKSKRKLIDEFNLVLKTLSKKLMLAFDNLSDSAGSLDELGTAPYIAPFETPESIEPFEEGTETPGIRIEWDCDNEYVESVILKLLNTKVKFKQLNRKFGFIRKNSGETQTSQYTWKIVLKMNATAAENASLSDPDENLDPGDVQKWSGNIYLRPIGGKITPGKDLIKLRNLYY
jgi:hypothetical protein